MTLVVRGTPCSNDFESFGYTIKCFVEQPSIEICLLFVPWLYREDYSFLTARPQRESALNYQICIGSRLFITGDVNLAHLTKGVSVRFLSGKSESVSPLVMSKFCNLMAHSPPGSTIHGISQARMLQWVTSSLLQGIFPTQGSNPVVDCTYVAGGFFTVSATRGVLLSGTLLIFLSLHNVIFRRKSTLRE